MKKKTTRRLTAIVVIFLSCFGSITARAEKSAQQKKSKTAISEQKSTVSAYLFFNGKDQDAGCSQIYSLFDELSAQLPVTAKKMKIDVNKGDQALFKKFNVVVLPTVLFADDKGSIQSRVDGEGSEAVKEIHLAFLKASKGSGSK